MNEHERLGHPAFDRLVAADPAKRAPDPVQGVLRAKVDALIAEQDGREPGEREPAEHGADGHRSAGHEASDELAVRRHRRRTPWLVAAAVAGIVAAGGGGYVAGESGLGSASVASDAGEPETAGAPAPMEERDEGTAESGEGSPESGAVSEGVQPLHADGDVPAATGLVFHAGVGLSHAPGTAEVRTAEASGSENLGSYPIVSEVEAVERLGDPRFAGAVVGSRQASPADKAPAGEAPAPGGAIVWPVEDVTILSASLTQMRYTLPDGTVLLVPAYDLTDAAGSSWTVMAVDEELLDFAP